MRSTLGTGFLALALCSLAPGLAAAEKPEERETIHLFPRSTYAWPFATGPVYGDVDAVRWKESGVLHTRVGSFDLKRGGPAIPEELRATVKADCLRHHPGGSGLLRGRPVRSRPLAHREPGRRAPRGHVGRWVHHASDPRGTGLLKSQPGVVAVEPYHPAFKLAPTIGRVPLPDPARAVSEVYALEALLHPGENAEAVARALADMGANVTKVDPDVVYFEIHRSKLGQVAGLEPVKAVFESLPNLAFGEETTVAVQTGRYGGGAIPYHDAGIRGDGGGIAGASAQILMVLDTGIQLDAGDLSDTRTNAGTAGAAHRKVRLYTTAVGGTGDAPGLRRRPSGRLHPRAHRGGHGPGERHRGARQLRRRLAGRRTPAATSGRWTGWLLAPCSSPTTPMSRPARSPAATRRSAG